MSNKKRENTQYKEQKIKACVGICGDSDDYYSEEYYSQALATAASGYDAGYDARDAEVKKLVEASIALRDAQKAYMADRGNDELGIVVAVRAKELYLILEEFRGGGDGNNNI